MKKFSFSRSFFTLWVLLASLLALVPTTAKAQFTGTVRQVGVFTTAGGAAVLTGMPTSNSSTVNNISLYQLIWTGSGTRTTCTVEIKAASTLTGSYTLIGSAQTCTSDGNYMLYLAPASTNAFVQIAVTAITGTGNTLKATLVGFTNTPTAPQFALGSLTGSGIQNCSTSASCASPATLALHYIVYTQVAFSSSTTLALTGIPTGYFTGTTTYACFVQDTSHPTYTFGTANQSATATTITASTSNSDAVNVNCFGY